MVSLKTKNKSKSRLFLIALTSILGSVLVVSAYSLLFSNQTSTSLVKDESVSLQDISEELHTEDPVEHISTQDDKPVITTYTVTKGDTLGGIANKFSISVNTLLWANDLDKKSAIKEGQKLSIPNAELPLEKTKTEDKRELKKSLPTESIKKVEDKKEQNLEKEDSSEKENNPLSMAHPIPSSVLTQGKHGYNGVDFGAPVGTKVYASLSGKVIIAKPDGYNGGYGHYIVIGHDNGTQTLYAHLSKLDVSVGDEVAKGDHIALSGNTGRSTGPHLHFEVRGGTNPWVGFSKMTKF